MSARSLAFGLLMLMTAASGAPSPREEHGSADVYAAPGVVLAWAVLRGASEAATSVVIRIATDPQVYPWVAVAGIDPFTKAEQPLRQAAPVTGTLDVQIPRSRFADLPRTELRFYDTAAAAQSAAPVLTVFYLGIPDTAPEFSDKTGLDAYLADRIVRAHAEKKSP
jgi:hypothetical protein